MKTAAVFLALPFFLTLVNSQISPLTPTAIENENVTVTCMTTMPPDLLIDSVPVETAKPGFQQRVVSNGVEYTFMVERSDNGSTLTCANTPGVTATTLVVYWAADYSGSTNSFTGDIVQPLEVSFTVSANPEPTSSVLTRADEAIDTERISVLYNLVNFTSLRCADEGMYTITATNEAGNGSFSFSIAVNNAKPIFLGTGGMIKISLGERFDVSKYLSACPDLVDIECATPLGFNFTASVNIGDNKLNSLLLTFNRDQLTTSEKSVAVNVSCKATNTVGDVTFMTQISVGDYASVTQVKFLLMGFLLVLTMSLVME